MHIDPQGLVGHAEQRRRCTDTDQKNVMRFKTLLRGFSVMCAGLSINEKSRARPLRLYHPWPHRSHDLCSGSMAAASGLW
jgi:hypothetical protein